MNITEQNIENANYYGYENQSHQLIEECAELIQAVNKFRRAHRKGDKEGLEIARDNLIEEVADVELMLEQIKYLLKIPESSILGMKHYKVHRTKENIWKEKSELFDCSVDYE